MSAARIEADRRTRLASAAAAAGLHVAAIAGLIAAFGVEGVVATVRAVAAFDIPLPPPPPPPPPEPEPIEAPRPQGRAAPPAPKATPSAAIPTKPRVVVRPSPAPTVAANGRAATSGAAASGTGVGAGGQGSGMGAGGQGSGSGGIVRRAEKIAGELRTRDFPRSGADQRDGRFIIVRYEVGADGRVHGCRVVQSSGSAEADAITCRLIERRFRYRPAEDAAGNPVPDQTGWKQWWWRP